MKKSVARVLVLALLTIAVSLSFPQDSPTGALMSAASCADPLGVVNDFYKSNEAGRFDASVRLFTTDATFATWATGVNGHMMVQRHLAGKRQIRKFLPDGRGVRRRLPGVGSDGPVYRQTKVSVSGNTVRFVLEPDRRRADGREYNYFSVEAILAGCLIRSLTVIEQITWL